MFETIKRLFGCNETRKDIVEDTPRLLHSLESGIDDTNPQNQNQVFLVHFKKCVETNDEALREATNLTFDKKIKKQIFFI
jgi:hypothetical protein